MSPAAAAEWVLVQPGGAVLAERPDAAAIEAVAKDINARRHALGLPFAIAMPRARYEAMFPEATERMRHAPRFPVHGGGAPAGAAPACPTRPEGDL